MTWNTTYKVILAVLLLVAIGNLVSDRRLATAMVTGESQDIMTVFAAPALMIVCAFMLVALILDFPRVYLAFLLLFLVMASITISYLLWHGWLWLKGIN